MLIWIRLLELYLKLDFGTVAKNVAPLVASSPTNHCSTSWLQKYKQQSNCTFLPNQKWNTKLAWDRSFMASIFAGLPPPSTTLWIGAQKYYREDAMTIRRASGSNRLS